jgi:hypothetical protein
VSAPIFADTQSDFVRCGAPLEMPDMRSTVPAERRPIESL